MNYKTMKKSSVLLLLFVLLFSFSLTANASIDQGWSACTEMGEGKAYLGVQSIGDNIFTFGGQTNYAWPFSLNKYNETTGSWQHVDGSYTYMTENWASAACNNKLYLFGNGYDYESRTNVESYDPETGLRQWVASGYGELPFAPATAVVGEKIYILGGGEGNTYDCTNEVKIFNTATGSFVMPDPMSSPVMPAARGLHSASVVNGKIYIMGGRIAGQLTDKVEEYDPSTNTWIEKAHMPVGRDSFAAVTAGNKILVIGGKNDQGILDTIDVYDPANDSWSNLNCSISSPRYGLSAAFVNGNLYIAGGKEADHWNCLTTFEKLKLTPEIPTGISATPNPDALTLTWGAVNGATRYDIEFDGVIKSVEGSQCLVNGLVPETEHVIRIRAVNEYGLSDWSQPLNTSTSPLPNVDIPTNVSASAAIVISWNAVPGATGYDIEVDGLVIDNKQSTQYIHTNIVQGTTHAYRIRARIGSTVSDWGGLIETPTVQDN